MAQCFDKYRIFCYFIRDANQWHKSCKFAKIKYFKKCFSEFQTMMQYLCTVKIVKTVENIFPLLSLTLFIWGAGVNLNNIWTFQAGGDPLYTVYTYKHPADFKTFLPPTTHTKAMYGRAIQPSGQRNTRLIEGNAKCRHLRLHLQRVNSLCVELEKMPLITIWSTFLEDDDEWIIASSKQCISPGFAYVGTVGKSQL